MVSLNQRQELADTIASDPHLKNIQLLIDGSELLVTPDGGGDVRERLLLAISSNNSPQFRAIAAEVGQRKISVDVDWCRDDYLLFLLLLGKAKFGEPLSFPSKIIVVRRTNSNPFPRKINEVFATLEREEFEIDGEYGFLKIPFLRLVGKLRLGPAEARKALHALSAPGLLDPMSPFLKLLTENAYDLVLVERQPLPTETTAQLIEGFENHARNLSLKEWWRVIVALPGRFIIAIILAVAGLGLIPMLIGVGEGFVKSWWLEPARLRPKTMTIAGIREPGSELPQEILKLAPSLQSPAGSPNKRSVLVAILASPFEAATPTFVVEVSHPDRPIRAALAFTQAESTGQRPFTIVPIQRESVDGFARFFQSNLPVNDFASCSNSQQMKMKMRKRLESE
jgi:hypothetical protein